MLAFGSLNIYYTVEWVFCCLHQQYTLSVFPPEFMKKFKIQQPE